MTPLDWDIPAVRNGIHQMLQRRSEALDRGERAIGWKLAFGAPAFLEKFGLSGPVVGYLTEAGQHRPGSLVSCEGWVNPVAEPEVAAHIGRDVEDPHEVAAAVIGLGPALELADIDSPPENIEAALAGNVFHRAVILGDPDHGRAGAVADGLRARISRDGHEIASVDDVEALTGGIVEILRHAAALLGAAGERLRKGDVVILGSVIPPVAVEPGQEILFELSPLPAISVRV